MPGNQRLTSIILCPEIRAHSPEGYTEKNGIWHLGVTVIELVMDEIELQNIETVYDIISAFHAAHEVQANQNVSMLPTVQIKGTFMQKTMSKLILRRYFSPELVDLVVQCTHNHPDDRATTEDLLNHSFFQRFVSDEVKLQQALTEVNLLSCK
ncbi:hypothetical protein AG4045_028652 [Apium graveolens]|uniref:mitogen-activated protein kinase kinase n=1 Tax=Apium graveolens TaxID=4045 RepID=A0A6L5BB60_APIGR|nr:hypothetical protein AG4045_028652 [Apium graveolens]